MSYGKMLFVTVLAWGSWAPAQMFPNTQAYCVTTPAYPQDWGRNTNLPDANGRPTMTPACGMPAEYDCPLFDKRPQDGLNQAIDSLMSVLTITPECKDVGGSSSMVAENATLLRDALQKLQAMSTGKSGAPVDPTEVQKQINIAVNSGNVLGQIFSNNALLNSRCGKAISGTGETLLAINDLLNSLSPFALMASSYMPGIGTAAQFAITGGSLVTSAIANVVNLVNQGKLDMNNPQIRRAVLKNTCLFTKIARKAHYMQLAASNQIQAINDELNREKDKPIEKFATSNPDLQKELEYRESLEQSASVVENQRRRDNLELGALEMEAREYQDDELSLCLRAQELVKSSSQIDPNGSLYTRATTIFPMSLILNLNVAQCLVNGQISGVPADIYSCQNQTASNPYPFPNQPSNPFPTDPNAPQTPPPGGNPERDALIKTLRSANGISRQRLQALEQKVLDNDPNAIHFCATVAKTWIKTLRQIHTVTGEIVNGERSRIDDDLRKDPSYAVWVERAQNAKAQEITISRVARVMKELAKDNSVIDRSELDQRMTLLQGALFGYRDAWVSNSPIDQWLTHTLKLHAARIGSFNENVRQLQASSSRLQSGSTFSLDRQAQVMSTGVMMWGANGDDNLDNMTLEKIPLRTRGHEIACQLLKTTWLDWSAAVDHLGASGFMCDMIDDYIDNKIQRGISTFCRGEIGFDSKQISPSRLQIAHKALLDPNAGGGKSSRDFAILIAKKVQDLKCPMPSVTVMN